MATFIEETDSPQDQITPTLGETLRTAMRAISTEMRVAIPAKVIKYDKDKQFCDCQPVIKETFRDESTEEMPIIYSVPVAHQRAGDAYIHMPLAKGHYVLLVFSDRSLDKWLSTGGIVSPDDKRLHHLSDAVAIPGCYPFNEASDVDNAKDIILKNQTLEMRIKPNNHLEVINSSNELLAVLDELVQTIRDAVVYTSTGAQQLRHANFAIVHDKLKSFVEK